jgi:hypothetical protein
MPMLFVAASVGQMQAFFSLWLDLWGTQWRTGQTTR